VTNAAHAFDRKNRAEVRQDLLFDDLVGMASDLSTVDLVITPLIGAGFDAIDLIERLAEKGFRGKVQVMARQLPDRLLVLHELLAVATPLGMTVDLRLDR
jgi:hypothetical protein